jgi:hypothetical protein
VTTALRYRLFGIGKMPPALREASEDPGVLLVAEGVSIKQSVRSLRMPRASVNRGVKLLVGSVVFLPGRLLASVARHVILDTEFAPDAEGDQQITVAEDGIRIAFDVATVIDGGSGSVDVHFRIPLTSSVTAQLPSTPCAVSLSNALPALLNGWKGSWSR